MPNASDNRNTRQPSLGEQRQASAAEGGERWPVSRVDGPGRLCAARQYLDERAVAEPESVVKGSFPAIAACALLALSGCSKSDRHPANDGSNDSSARDAAPGRLSETEPLSATKTAPAQNMEPDTRSEPPR